jgi:hypothetical protein
MMISIMGKRWKLCFARLSEHKGDCSGPAEKNKKIRIDSRLKGEERLEILIHEFRHAADWGQSELFVDNEAKDMARMLWRLGYRREDDK